MGTSLFWMVLTNVCTASVSYLLFINVYSSDLAVPAPCSDAREIVLSNRLDLINIDQPKAINCISCSSYATTANSNISGSGNITMLELKETNSRISCQDPDAVNASQPISSESSRDLSALKTILAITPTYTSLTQKVDLVSLCHTMMHVPNSLWIVVEEMEKKSDLVRNVLRQCDVNSVHLNVVTSNMTKRADQRGVENRNAGLDWIRAYCKENCHDHCSAVVYFMDHNNKYDLRLFQELRKTKTVSVFPVGFSGGLTFEGPICKEEKAVAWQGVWQSKERDVPVDMEAFAINMKLFLQKPNVKVGYIGTKLSRVGFMASDLITSLGSSRDKIECRGIANEVLVWHITTITPFISYKNKYPFVEV